MSCCSNLMNGGIAKSCGPNIGGISVMYITDFCNIDAYNDSSPSGEIESIDMNSGTVFYTFEFNKNTSTLAEVNTNTPEGSSTWTQTVTLVLSKRERAKREKLALMVQKDLAIIVKDSNGNYWCVGKTNGATLDSINSESGTARTDVNKYTLTLTAIEPEHTYPVLEAAILAVL